MKSDRRLGDDAWVFLGVGGARPEVLVFDGVEVRTATPGKPGHSVYRIAVTPGNRRVVIGTRNKAAGDRYTPVMVYDRMPDGTLSGSPVRSWYQPSAITGLGALTDDLFVSAGAHGSILLWDYSEPKKARGTFGVNEAAILSLVALSDSLFATVSADAALRLWDVNTGTPVREVELEGPGDGRVRLLSLAAAPEHRLVVSLSPGGRVALHSLDDELGLHTVQPKPVLASSVEVVGEWMVLADTSSSRLVASRLPDLEVQRVATLEHPVHALVSVSNDSFISIHHDGSGTFWTLRDGLGVISVLQTGNLRCGNGPPRSMQLELGRRRRESDRKEGLRRAMEFLRGGQQDQLLVEVERLSRQGMGLESLLILAESYRTQGHVLWELRARLALALELDDTPEHSVHFVTLADLLETLGEPGRARGVFQRALEADPSRSEVAEKLAALEGQEGPSSLPVELIRDDLHYGPEALLQEVEKMATLGIEWCWRSCYRREESDTVFAESLGDVEVLAHHLGADTWRTESVQLYVGPEAVVESVWAVRQVDVVGRATWTLAVEPLAEPGRVRLAFRLILEPRPTGSVEDTAISMLDQVRQFQKGHGRADTLRRLRNDVETRARVVSPVRSREKEF